MVLRNRVLLTGLPSTSEFRTWLESGPSVSLKSDRLWGQPVTCVPSASVGGRCVLLLVSHSGLHSTFESCSGCAVCTLFLVDAWCCWHCRQSVHKPTVRGGCTAICPVTPFLTACCVLPIQQAFLVVYWQKPQWCAVKAGIEEPVPLAAFVCWGDRHSDPGKFAWMLYPVFSVLQCFDTILSIHLWCDRKDTSFRYIVGHASGLYTLICIFILWHQNFFFHVLLLCSCWNFTTKSNFFGLHHSI